MDLNRARLERAPVSGVDLVHKQPEPAAAAVRRLPIADYLRTGRLGNQPLMMFRTRRAAKTRPYFRPVRSSRIPS
jgi:hypothetical protein